MIGLIKSKPFNTSETNKQFLFISLVSFLGMLEPKEVNAFSEIIIIVITS